MSSTADLGVKMRSSPLRKGCGLWLSLCEFVFIMGDVQ
uniref:Uncharacterized protein n=1 Tax=Anguilla anguilla TaxID=7936 RepID=A0A0E9QFQ4_ANGAN